MRKMKCNLCEAEWDGADAYCPRCGSPLLHHPRRARIWEIAAVIIALSILIWWKR